MNFCRKPCNECPWRTDVPTGRFKPERYRRLARSAEDLSGVLFACHKTAEGKEVACAGFLLRGATHNMAVRLARVGGDLKDGDVSDGGLPLFNNYTEMAVANGVRRRDPALKHVRDDQ